MVDVSARIAALEGNRPQLSAELARFLDLVWSNRARIALSGPGTGGKLYGLYARRPNAQLPATAAQVLPFLKRLAPLCQQPIAQPYGIQGFDLGIEISDCIECIEDAESEGNMDDEGIQGLLWDLGYTFYHLPITSNSPAGARIYLNVTVAFSVDVMTFVLDLVARFPDALKAKLAGPCNVRADRIVIWVTSLERIDAILAALAEYQQMHRAFFMDGIPRLCKQVMLAGRGKLRGVGIASEPARQDGCSISYGKSRTIAIYTVGKS